MATWALTRTADGNLELTYRTPSTRSVHRAGVLRSDTPVAMVVEWILDQAATQYGDIVVLPDKSIIQFLPPGRGRA